MKKLFVFLMFLITSLLLISCTPKSSDYETDIYYTLFVRSFADSDGDGIGDLNGVTENLDYLEELGVTGVWLLPIFESPSYHGYDTTDYYEINQDYGTMEDLDNLVKEANKRDIKILLDLVINHTSDKHPWYVEARANKDSKYRDYYVWNHESFPGGMKDLDLSNPDVVKEINEIAKFYLDKGVHGFRLDAVHHFFEESGSHLQIAQNTIFMNQFTEYLKTIKEDVFIVGEVFVNDYNLLSNYVLGGGSYFNFYLQNELRSKVGSGESRTLLSSNIVKNYDKYYETRNDYYDSVFLGNHDMDRVATSYENLDKVKLATTIMMTLPGNPFIYYGDELGMKGSRYEGTVIHDKVVYDEYRRQPFIWGNDKTTSWLKSDGSNDNTKSLIEQREDENSMFNHYKEMIKLRKDNPALMEGREIYKYDIPGTQSYIRVINNDKFKQALLVVNNLFDRVVELDIDLELVYGNKILKGNNTTIFEIPINKLGEYT